MTASANQNPSGCMVRAMKPTPREASMMPRTCGAPTGSAAEPRQASPPGYPCKGKTWKKTKQKHLGHLGPPSSILGWISTKFEFPDIS